MLYRKIFAKFLGIRNNRLLVLSMNGTNFGCNPKAIADALLAKYSDKVEIFVAFQKEFRSTTVNSRIKTVELASQAYFRVAATAKVIIHNTHFDFCVPLLEKRKGQIYIQTWHGTALKKIAKDVADALHPDYLRKAIEDSRQSDVMLSGSKYHTHTIEKSFWFSGKILEFGMPRNDLFSTDNQVLKQKIFSKLKIENDTRIAFFCPTFRTYSDNFHFDFDAEKLLQTFREKFGGKWRLFVRLHPCMNDVDKVINFNKLLMTNLTNYSDVQELLHISDILITDYSSVMFDFMLTRRPCFLFATDVDTYDRGTYIDINKLPFPLAENNRELIQNVENFDESIYLSDLQQFENYVLQSFENGTAAFKVADYIAEIISN